MADKTIKTTKTTKITKRLAKGQRTHIRRVKQAAGKETVVNKPPRVRRTAAKTAGD